VTVEDACARPGGLLETRQTAEGLVETAARGFIWTDNVAALFAAAGVAPQFADDRSKRRYIFRNGRPRRWPLTALETMALAAHGGRAAVGRQLGARDGESVDAWGRRVLGRAGTEWLLAPALQGIYASPPAELSARAIFGGGRLRGKLATAPRGMRQLADGLVAALTARGATVTFNARLDTLDASVPTVIATPPTEAARLLAPHAPAVAAALGAIRMSSLCSVTAFYTPHPGDTRGFGMLFPRTAGLDALGVLFNADMFAGRSEYRSETWIYGDTSADVIEALRADAGARLARDRHVLTGRHDSPIAVYPTMTAQRLPVYDEAVIRAAAQLAALPPWLAVTGNYLGRIGVSAIVDRAEDTAKGLAQRLGFES
jgi:oxygen-dependent protoporphyrinogen oxidase